MSDLDQDIPNPNPAGQAVSPEQGVPIDAASLARHYEQDDVDLRVILWFAGGLAVVLVIVHLVLYWVVSGWTNRPLPIRMQVSPAEVTPQAVPGPGLDAAPETELDVWLDIEMERLSTYGWIDRDAGVVRIPIERAMSLLLEEGLPARDGEIPNFGLDPAFQLDSSGGTWLGNEETRDEEARNDETGNGGSSEGETEEGESPDDG